MAGPKSKNSVSLYTALISAVVLILLLICGWLKWRNLPQEIASTQTQTAAVEQDVSQLEGKVENLENKPSQTAGTAAYYSSAIPYPEALANKTLDEIIIGDWEFWGSGIYLDSTLLNKEEVANWNWHLGEDVNPHTTTLEQARTAGNRIFGPIIWGANSVALYQSADTTLTAGGTFVSSNLEAGTFANQDLRIAASPTFNQLNLAVSQGVTGLTTADTPTFLGAILDSLIFNADPGTILGNEIDFDTGAVNFPNATSAVDALVLGTDTNLYRGAADTLMTDDALTVSGALLADSTLTITSTFNANGNATLGSDAADTLTVNAGPANFPNATSAADALILGGDTNLYRSGANVLLTDDALTITGALTGNGDVVLGSDAADTLTVNAGPANFPNATAAADALILGGDANLYRSAADTLKTDDALIVTGTLTANGNITLGDNASDTLTVNAGPANFPNATAAADAIVIGADTNLYRSGASILATDDKLALANGIANPTTTAYGLTFGGTVAGTPDVNLYRSAANLLKTDNNLDIENHLAVGNGGIIDNALANFNEGATINSGRDAVHIGLDWFLEADPSGDIHALNIYSQLGTGSFDYNSSLWGQEINTVLRSEQNATLLTGLELEQHYLGLATLAESKGIINTIFVYNGAITTAYGFESNAQLGAIDPGQIGTLYNFYVRNPTMTGVGNTIETQYGLYIEDLTRGTTDYGIAIAGADTQVLWLSSGADNTDAANGIAFGLSRDTNLYRSAADTLKTDDAFVVAGQYIGVPAAATSTGAIEGAMYWDTDLDELCVYDVGTAAFKCSATFPDYAENYLMEPAATTGDVMAIKDSDVLKKAANPYDAIAGVYSSNPGVLINKLLTGGKPLALKGRVPVKASAENGAIAAGDRLTASSTLPGYAAKSTKGDQSLVGIALEGLDSGTGVIELFVNAEVQNIEVAQSTDSQFFEVAGGDVVFKPTDKKLILRDVTMNNLTALGDDSSMASLLITKDLTVQGNARVMGEATFDKEVTFGESGSLRLPASEMAPECTVESLGKIYYNTIENAFYGCYLDSVGSPAWGKLKIE